jgi:CheY-like chemotaxis protein
MMPEMDGIETTLKIRDLEGKDYYKTVPIVALTANAVSGVREMFMQNGFDDFLAKPIEIAKLNEILETWLPTEKRQPYAAKEAAAAAPAFEIQGIDVRTGMFMTGGSEDNYLRALSAYHRDGQEKIGQLADCCRKGDLKLYAVYAHAVKSASASIGATKVSSFAKALELASKNEDLDYVRENNDIFLSEFKALLGNIGCVISANRKNGNGEADAEFVRERIAGLRNALVDFDIETADEILRGLQSGNTDEKTSEALDNIANTILICEYDKALEIAEKLLKNGGTDG